MMILLEENIIAWWNGIETEKEMGGHVYKQINSAG